MFEQLIELIEKHPTYNSALNNAIARELPLVLNYHTHTGEESYCVSICTKMGFPVAFFEEADGNLEELVHVRSFAKKREQCIPMLTELNKEMRQHYKLKMDLIYFLDGKPMDADNQP
jgi:hypothetical protein